MQHLQDAAQFDDNGLSEQAGRTHELSGNAAHPQCCIDLGKLIRGHRQDSDAIPVILSRTDLSDAISHPLEFFRVGREQTRTDVTGAPVGGLGGKWLDPGVHLTQGARNLIGEIKDAGAGTTVLAQRIALRLATVRLREVLDEILDIRHARTAPAVDRLAGIADRGDRMATTEDLLQQAALGDRGVLVLVEQHD